MAASPSPPDPGSEERLIGLYQAAEGYLLAQAARILTATLAAGGVLAALPQLRRLTQRTVLALTAATPALVQAMVAAETTDGRGFADRAIARIPAPPATPAGTGGGAGAPPRPPGTALEGDGGFFDLSMDHGDRAAALIRADLTSQLQDVRFRITRLPDDIYKAIAPQGGIVQVLDNNATAAQAQAAAWRAFTSSGVTGFTDRSGRDWALSSYVEMAVRTASARAFNAASVARMQAVGLQYFTVPPHVHPCPQCGPWQGAILTAGENPDPSIPTDGTIEEATAAGLFHPNCRDTLVGWNPAAQARPDRREWTGEDDIRYRATQQQRALEREIRKAKIAAAHGLTPEARAEGRRDVHAAQARIRQHLTKHPNLGRQPRREKPHLGQDAQNLTPWRPPPGPKPPFSDGSAPDWTAAAP